MTEYNKTTFILFLIFATGRGIMKSNILFKDKQLFLNNLCISMRGNVRENGTCNLIKNCEPIRQQLILRNYSFTVCGYEGVDQIVCCPSIGNNANLLNLRQANNKIELSKSQECIVSGTQEIGVFKFKSECENFIETGISEKISDYEIYNDLICCPTKSNARLKQVCSNVDLPVDLVTFRLHLNQPCLVKDTNLTGRYQQKCEFATRNNHMKSKLQNVCDDDVCNGWYCCPIEEPNDYYHCEHTIPLPNVKIVGPECVDSKTRNGGRCRKEGECYGFNVTELDKCGHHCCNEYYCCPNPIQDLMFLAEQKCWEYSNFINKDEVEVKMDLNTNRTICSAEVSPVGGKAVDPGEHPHMAAIGYKINETISFVCGGSLISDEYVLTAAHCLVSNRGLLVVRLGGIDLLNDTDILDCPEEYEVIQSIRHPNYKRRMIYDDIGLIQLHRKVKFSFHIRPICLPTTSHLDMSIQFESMGWGELGFGLQNKKLQLIKVKQTLYSHDRCQKYYENNNNSRIRFGINEETQLCAGSIYDNQSTCSGDSGGPILTSHLKIGRTYKIIGIVSSGTTCGYPDTPGIYTKVYPYLDWIQSIVFPNTD